MLMYDPWGLCHQCLCSHSEPQSTCTSPKDHLTSAGMSGAGSRGITALPCSSARGLLCASSKSGVCFPRPVWLLYSGPAGRQSQILWGVLPVPDPRLRSLMGGSEPTPIGEPLKYNDPSVCGSSHVSMGFIVL